MNDEVETAKRMRASLQAKREAYYDDYATLSDQKGYLAQLHAVASNTRDLIKGLNTAGADVKEIIKRDQVPGYDDLFDLKSLESYTGDLNTLNNNFLESAETFGKNMDTIMSEVAENIHDCNRKIEYYEAIIRNS